jgi:hypothetical protein
MAARRKKPLSIDRHRELGNALHEMRQQAMKLAMEYQDGLRARELDALMKIEKTIDRARCALEDLALHDHRAVSRDEVLSLYYGHEQREHRAD